jgi:hypothetical protein
MAEESVERLFLESIRKRFRNVKELGDGALAQVRDEELAWTPHPECNSLAVQIQHLHGNMLSRWTEFLSSDGEKEWRDRDAEFVPGAADPATLRRLWEEGWACTLGAMDAIGEADLMRRVTIRGQSLGVVDAVLRQLAHYSYHVGQMVHTAKHLRGAAWKTLSIARGASGSYTPRKND